MLLLKLILEQAVLLLALFTLIFIFSGSSGPRRTYPLSFYTAPRYCALPFRLNIFDVCLVVNNAEKTEKGTRKI